MDEALASAHSFVRALKAPSDPPHEDWPTKLFIAKAAWKDSATRIPRKAGIILEWLLPQLTRVKSSEVEPILNPQYWELLADVLSDPGDTPLAPIVSRFTIAPSLLAIFLSYRSLSLESVKTLFSQVIRSLTILWPRSTHNLDTLSDLFWASVSLITETLQHSFDSHVIETIILVWSSFRHNFAIASANQKKKIFSAFSQYIKEWLFALQSDTEGVSVEELYQIGRHILFNLESLKSTLDSKQSTLCLLSLVFLNNEWKSEQTFRRCLLKVLPRLYKDHFTSHRQHQLALFPPSLSAMQVQERLAEMGTNSAIQIIQYLKGLEDLEDQSQLWSVIIEVLAVAEKEDIATIKNGTEWRSQLCDLRQRALLLMGCPWDETQVPMLQHALSVFCFLYRIEPELVDPVLPQVLGRVALTSPQVLDDALLFWKQILSFYSKTRTWHVFTEILQDALKDAFSLTSDMTPQNVYKACFHSPLISFAFLDELRGALMTYTSPGQAGSIIENIGSVLKNRIEGYSWTAPAAKRRKISESAGFDSTERRVDMEAVAFFMEVCINSSILEALSRRNIQALSACLIALDDCIAIALEQLFSFLKNHSSGTSSKKRKSMDTSMNWPDQCFFGSLLQLSYTLFVQYDHDVGTKARTLLNHAGAMSTFMKQVTMPEVQLELGRWCIYASIGNISEQSKETKHLDTVLDYIETHANFESTMSDGNEFCYHSSYVTRVLVAFLLEEYLPFVDAFASQAQLGRLLRLLIRQADKEPKAEDQLFMGVIVDRLFQNAFFWEMPNLKTALQGVLEEETSVLASKKTPIRPDLGAAELKRCMQCSHEDLKRAADIYRRLIRFPPNYLSKKSKDDLITKALNADIFISLRNSQNSGAEIYIAFRDFLSKCWNEQPSKLIAEIASDPSWVEYIFKEQSQENSQFYASSEGIQTALLKLILQNAAKGEGSSLDVILRMVLNSELKTGQNLSDTFIPSRVILVIDSIVNYSTRTGLSEPTLLLIHEMQARLGRLLESVSRRFLEENALQSRIHTIVKGWKAFLSLCVWNSSGPLRPINSRSICNTLFRRAMSLHTANLDSQNLYPDILSIMLFQSKLFNGTEESMLTEIVAGYLLVSQKTTSQACDEPLSRFCKELELNRYEDLLDILGEYLEKETTMTMLTAALHASILFLKDAPEKSFKISSAFASRCLRLLSNTDTTQLSASTISKIFELLRFQCSERAVALKSLDVGEILNITHSLTDGYHDHDDHTSYSIFHAIVSLLDDLVRLRHDLLNSFLPHISKILRRLILLLRTTRPHLGTKQYRFIADTYPRWVNPSESFRASDGTALARLLTSFNTKTSVRSRGGSELPKATSLARSFARHAPYVLLAYLEAISDPLTYISVQVRKELQPGLFALCAMTGEHGRDTLMIQNLDVEQKALLKTLWGDYARQKYTGKG